MFKMYAYNLADKSHDNSIIYYLKNATEYF